MGLFDSILNKGAKMLRDGSLQELAQSFMNKDDSTGYQQSEAKPVVKDETATAARPERRHVRENFEQKLYDVVNSMGTYSVRKNIKPEQIETEVGRQIYTRGGCYALPSNISYAVYRGETRIMYIRLWKDYAVYKRMANRQIKEYCDINGIVMLDFFDYMPNERQYMNERIRMNIVV